MAVTATSPTVDPIPLGTLGHEEREQVIAVLIQQFPVSEAVTLLTALAGTRAEVKAVPVALQERAQMALLATLPRGLGAIVVSTLGIPTTSDQEALEEVLTAQEQADPAFRQRVEVEARRRSIPRWLAASRLRWEKMSVDEMAATLQRPPGEPSPDRDNDAATS